MATSQHPTTEPDGDDATNDAEPESIDRPAIGIAHPTVVPTNLDRDD